MAKRKYGEGSIFLRKDGRWEGRVVVGYKENGNPKTKTFIVISPILCRDKRQSGSTERSAAQTRRCPNSRKAWSHPRQVNRHRPMPRQSRNLSRTRARSATDAQTKFVSIESRTRHYWWWVLPLWYTPYCEARKRSSCWSRFFISCCVK